MEDELRQFFRTVGRGRLKKIWQRVKIGDVDDLDGEDRQYAAVMADHRDEYFDEFEMADARLLDPKTDTDPFLHASLHVILEKQLREKAPIEAFQLYNALVRKKMDRHEAIHLLTAVFVPFLFDVLKTGREFDMEGYRVLLKKAKSREPEKIWELLDREVYRDEDVFEAAAGRAYRFRIELEDVDPPIWRSLRIPAGASFAELHAAIQAAMGWEDRHLHRFEVRDPASGKMRFIGRPLDENDWEDDVLPGGRFAVADFIGPARPHCVYIYDYGDNWRHRVELEEILALDPERAYPVCLDGERACPPEDVGGPPGYEDLLRILKDPDHEGFAKIRERVGDFDPERFDPAEVVFSAPEK